MSSSKRPCIPNNTIRIQIQSQIQSSFYFCCHFIFDISWGSLAKLRPFPSPGLITGPIASPNSNFPFLVSSQARDLQIPIAGSNKSIPSLTQSTLPAALALAWFSYCFCFLWRSTTPGICQSSKLRLYLVPKLDIASGNIPFPPLTHRI